MRALIDADVVAYRSAFAAEHMHYYVYLQGEEEYGAIAMLTSKAQLDEWLQREGTIGYTTDSFFIERVKEIGPVGTAIMAAKASIEMILEKLGVSSFKLYLTGSGNFREQIATIKKYKGNRDATAKPVHLQAVREYLIQQWDAELIEGMEADDKLGIEQSTQTIICSIDKDLKMIPGWHYDFVKDEKVYIDGLEAMRNFYRQCITGDTTDNIPGLYGITGKKATREILLGMDRCEDTPDMAAYVRSLYSGYEKELEEIKQLLWILREPRRDSTWQPTAHQESDGNTRLENEV